MPGPCQPETTPQPIKEDPDSPENICTEATPDAPKDVEEQEPKSPTETEPPTPQSSVEREIARRKEQERRRREAVSTLIHVPVVFGCSDIGQMAFLITVVWFIFLSFIDTCY